MKESFQQLIRRVMFSGPTEPLDAWIRAVEGCLTAKEKGDHFEKLCVAYLRHPSGGGQTGIDQVWTLAALPESVREALGLPARDYGIDIVARDVWGGYHAVQAKFKKRAGARRALRVTWRELSTFYALARRGPYSTHMVMTTADDVSRVGGVCDQDRSVCYQGLKAMPWEFWTDLAQMRGRRLGKTAAPLSAEEVRAARLARFAPVRDDAVDFDAVWAELGY